MATNFLQFDPYKNNLVTDGVWSASAFRLNGGTRGKVSSSDFNKLMYQVTTMVTALAQMMEEKGVGTLPSAYDIYTMSDISLSLLKRNLHNIMTRKDMTPYATNASLLGYTPINSVKTKTTDYSMLVTDYYSTIQMNSVSAKNIYLPATPAIGGGWVIFENINTGTLTIQGTVNGQANPTLSQYEMMYVYWDASGAKWYGCKIANTISAPIIPPGVVLPVAEYSVPIPGYLLCDGSTYNGALPAYANLFAVIGNSYGGVSPNFKVPDFRGYFLRGAGGGVDPDGVRAMNDVQADAAKIVIPDHTHTASFDMIENGDSSTLHPEWEKTDASSTITSFPVTVEDGGAYDNGEGETRPINKPIYYIIKT